MSYVFSVPIIIALSWYVGSAVPRILKIATGNLSPPDGISPENWSSLVTPLGEQSGRWMGFLERLFFAFVFAWNAYVLAVGWLALKLGSKWQTWAGISKTPDEFKGTEPEQWFLIRRKLGALLSQRFLIGTLSNLLLGWGISIIANGTSHILMNVLGVR